MITSNEIRHLALSLPEVTERELMGEMTFRVQGKIFLSLSQEGGEAVVKVSLDKQNILLNMDPKIYYLPNDLGRFGWVAVKLSSIQFPEMRELIYEAWWLTAPKYLIDKYDPSKYGR